MKVTVVGTGYVGLVTGACLADVGNDVLCVDVDADKVKKLKEGVIPIYEPGLEGIVKQACELGRLDFTTDIAEGVAHADVHFIAVGTPPDEDGSADLRYVLEVAKSIGEHMDVSKIIIDKSTVPVGTGDKVKAVVAEQLQSRGLDIDFHVVSNPEFLKEGAAIDDFMKPDRIIIGSDSDYAIEKMHELYAPFNRNHEKLISMDIRSAELTKYAANAMLATKISFMNELSNIAEKVNADIENVRIGIGSDPRIGYHFIYPGCGYGGSCFPKDVKALAHIAADVDYDAELLNSVEAVNARQKDVLFKKINQHYNGSLKGKTIAVWGLAFKPNTDDMREAPSINLMQALWNAGATVRAYDPEAMEETTRIFGQRDDLIMCDSPDAAIQGADALAVVTEWKVFRSPDFEVISQSLKDNVVFDGRNIYNPENLAKLGIKYYAIGRGTL